MGVTTTPICITADCASRIELIRWADVMTIACMVGDLEWMKLLVAMLRMKRYSMYDILRSEEIQMSLQTGLKHLLHVVSPMEADYLEAAIAIENMMELANVLSSPQQMEELIAVVMMSVANQSWKKFMVYRLTKLGAVSYPYHCIEGVLKGMCEFMELRMEIDICLNIKLPPVVKCIVESYLHETYPLLQANIEKSPSYQWYEHLRIALVDHMTRESTSRADIGTKTRDCGLYAYTSGTQPQCSELIQRCMPFSIGPLHEMPMFDQLLDRDRRTIMQMGIENIVSNWNRMQNDCLSGFLSGTPHIRNTHLIKHDLFR
jgi:hypothetical protein